MKVSSMKVLSVLVMATLLTVGQALADPELQRITAEQAFNAVQMQIDPTTGESQKVMMVDVRSRAEFYWVGAPCKVNSIVLEGDKTIVPDMGKVLLVHEGRNLLFRENNWPRMVPVCKVKSVDLAPIAVNIPYKLWDEATATMSVNDGFAAAVEALALEQGAEVVIFFCRSGGRSEACLAAFNNSLFAAIYEIDQPNLTDGFGGFEGTSYSNAYLGNRGFAGRDTRFQENPSVSWKDASLPIKTGVNPLAQ